MQVSCSGRTWGSCLRRYEGPSGGVDIPGREELDEDVALVNCLLEVLLVEWDDDTIWVRVLVYRILAYEGVILGLRRSDSGAGSRRRCRDGSWWVVRLGVGSEVVGEDIVLA